MMIKVRSCVELKNRKNYGCNQHEQLKSANILFQREAEKETPEDLKQAFRVFDKVSLTLKKLLFSRRDVINEYLLRAATVSYTLNFQTSQRCYKRKSF